MNISTWSEETDDNGDARQWDCRRVEYPLFAVLVGNELRPKPTFRYLGEGGKYLCSATGPWHVMAEIEHGFVGRDLLAPTVPGGYTLDGASWIGGMIISPERVYPVVHVSPDQIPSTMRIDISLSLHICAWFQGDDSATSPPRPDGLTQVATWGARSVAPSNSKAKVLAPIIPLPASIERMMVERPPSGRWGRFMRGVWTIGYKPVMVIRPSFNPRGQRPLTFEEQNSIARSLTLSSGDAYAHVQMIETWRMRDLTPANDRDDFKIPSPTGDQPSP